MKTSMKNSPFLRFLCALVLWFPCLTAVALPQNRYRAEGHIYLDTSNGYQRRVQRQRALTAGRRGL